MSQQSAEGNDSEERSIVLPRGPSIAELAWAGHVVCRARVSALLVGGGATPAVVRRAAQANRCRDRGVRFYRTIGGADAAAAWPFG